MRQHTNLPAMVRLVSNHVAQHLRPHRPRPRQPVPQKLRHPPAAAQRLRQHLHAPSATLRQPGPRLIRSTPRPVQQRRNREMRRSQPHPLAAHVMHMSKNRRNRPHPARRLRLPHCRIKRLDQELIHPLIGSKNPHRRRPNLPINLVDTRAQTNQLLAPIIRPACIQLRVSSAGCPRSLAIGDRGIDKLALTTTPKLLP